MENKLKKSDGPIRIETLVNAPMDAVWRAWTNPEDIRQWNSASPDWHTPSVENDLRPRGRFTSRMESRDGKEGFDFGGTYTLVERHEKIAYTLDDGRKVEILFTEESDRTHINESFEAESMHPREFQEKGWQAILDNFRQYVESKN